MKKPLVAAVAVLSIALPAAARHIVRCGPPSSSRTIPSGENYTLDLSATEGADEVRIDEARGGQFAHPLRSITWVPGEPEPVFMHLTMNDQSLSYRITRMNDGDRNFQPCTYYDYLTIQADRKIRDAFRRSVVPFVQRSGTADKAHIVTSLRLDNPEQHDTLSGSIIFRPAGAEGTTRDPAIRYSVPQGHHQDFPDLLLDLGIRNGIGSLDIVPDDRGADWLPVSDVRIRTIGEDGAAGGMTVPQVRVADFAAQSVISIPVPLADLASVSIGVRTWDSGGTLTVHVDDPKQVRDVDVKLLPNFGQLMSLDELAGFHVETPAMIVIHATGAVVYAIETDSATNEPRMRIPFGELEGEKTFVGEFFQ